MSNYSDAHGAAATIVLTLRNNEDPAKVLAAVCEIPSYDRATDTWTRLDEAALELRQYVGTLAESGQYSDLTGIDLAVVDWEGLLKGEID